MMIKRLLVPSLVLLLAASCYSATFGTVVPVRGTPSDIALDEQRGRLYIGNLAAHRVEVLNTSDLKIGSSMSVPKPPSAVALSPDGRFLVAGLYDPYPEQPAEAGGLAIFNLESGERRDISFANPVLAMSFGAGTRALVVTTTEFLLLDPSTAEMERLDVTVLAGQPLPVPFGSFPPDIVRAATGVSGDGKSIVVMAEVTYPPDDPPATAILQYHVGDTAVKVLTFLTSPPMGPRAVSVNQDGSSFIAGWVLMDQFGRNHAQFPYVSGDFRKGGHAFDYARNRIYADVPVPSAGEEKILHVMATDNLAVTSMSTDNPAGRERIQLPQMMAGRSLFTSDMQTLYAISDSGVMVLPVGSLSKTRRVAALQEDVLFRGDACTRGVISKSIDIVDIGGGNTEFTLSLPSGVSGVRLLQTSGVTPAHVQIDVDPAAFQAAKGTTAVMLNIESSKAVNIPFPVRLLINTRDMNQRGTLVNVPGKVVDLLADRDRGRLYMLRQDTDEVLVYDSSTMRRVDGPALRTGNTPLGMALTEDHRYLLVGNDNSQYVSVFDLDTMQPSEPIWFYGHYPRSVAVGNGGIWATARPAGEKSMVFRIDFESRTAVAPYSLGIYCNNKGENVCQEKQPNFAESVLASTPSGGYVLLATPDGAVALWEAQSKEWVLSRDDLGPVSGAFGALSDTRFVVGDNLLDEALYPIAKLQTDTGATSGTAMAGNFGLRSTAKSAAGPGALERIDLDGLQSFNGTAIIESPHTAGSLLTTRIGQVGQTILGFTRTLAILADQTPLLLTQSGITVLAPDFDAPTTIPHVTRVVSLADNVSGVAPGGLVSIQGTGLAPKFVAADGTPLPTALGEACATVNDVALPLFRVSPTEFAAQLPFSVSGDAKLVVRSPGGISDPFPFEVQDFAPAIFRNGTVGDQTGVATVIREKNGELVNFTNPIHTEEMITIYLTGMGLASPEPPLGDISPIDALAMVTTPPVVTLGGVPLQVVYAGLTPGSIGVYQINAWVPGAVRTATQAPLRITQGDASTALQVRVVNP